ncbi:MAG: glycosyltransferase [Ilumatobacteraceae bacterium]
MPAADVLVVDDNSPDGTGALAEQTAAELGQVKVLHRPGKQGLGSAYRNGFQVALDEGTTSSSRWTSDFSHDPTAIPTLLAAVDVAAGTDAGTLHGPVGAPMPSSARATCPAAPRPTGRCIAVCCRAGGTATRGWCSGSVCDATSGFRAYRAVGLA